MNRHTTRILRAVAAPLLLSALVSSSALGCRPPATASAPARAAAAPGAAAPLAADLVAAFTQAEREAAGHLGVGILHVESGERGSFHGEEPFPMQSVFKLPLAIDVLARVDAGELRLDEVLPVRPIDIRPGPPHSLADEIPATGGERTVLDLLERALLTSDNTAADVLLERIGGPRKVTERLVGLGIPGIDVSRSEAELMLDFVASRRGPRATPGRSLASWRASRCPATREPERWRPILPIGATPRLPRRQPICSCACTGRISSANRAQRGSYPSSSGSRQARTA